jgi:hypothetical protein
MTTQQLSETVGTPTLEVRVYRGDTLIERELCESEDEVALVVATWSEREDLDDLVDLRVEIGDPPSDTSGSPSDAEPVGPFEEDYQHEGLGEPAS